jgi:hypothetical protein
MWRTEAKRIALESSQLNAPLYPTQRFHSISTDSK